MLPEFAENNDILYILIYCIILDFILFIVNNKWYVFFKWTTSFGIILFDVVAWYMVIYDMLQFFTMQYVPLNSFSLLEEWMKYVLIIRGDLSDFDIYVVKVTS